MVESQAPAGVQDVVEATNDELQQAAYQVTGGHLDEGEAIARNVLDRQPQNAQALYVLGLSFYMRKQYKEASETFAEAAKYAPGNPMIYSNLGESLRRMREPEKALGAFQRSLQLLPNFNMGMMGVANCLSDLKQNQKALQMFQRLLSGNPDFAPAYHYLGAHLVKQEQHKRALPLLRKAVALRENYSDALMTLASCLESLDQVDEAIRIFENLLEEQPNNLVLLINLGNIKKTQGKMAEADALFMRVLELDPDNVAVQYSISHGLDGNDAGNIDALEKRFEDPELGKEAARALHFTVGKYCDDQREYARAFEHFRQGNDMDDRIDPYDADTFSKGVDRLIEVFDEEFFKRRFGMGAESEAPIFIVGMPRSGTSLTEQILSSHSRVYGAGELRNIGDLMRMIQVRFRSKANYPDSIRMLDPITACNLGERYLKETRELAGNGDYDRITDKMPGNSTNLGLISLILPRARVVHCKRNPMDSCFSNYSHNFASVISYSRKLDDLGRHYRDYHRLMEHWKRVLPLKMMEVRYEEMVADNETMSRQLLEFCGLEWDDACLDFQKTERRVKTASTMQIRQPIYKSSVSRWHRYEQELQPLFEALGDLAPREIDGQEYYP